MTASLPARLLSRIGRGGRDSVTVLTYHSIGDNDTPLTVPVANFERQMAWVRDHCSPLRPRDVEAFLDGGLLPPNPVLVTFDDGYRDNLLHAWPVLKSLAIPSVLFVITGFVGARIPLYTGEMLPALSWDEIRELAATDLVEIGAHTRTHQRLSEVPESDARRTIVDSRTDIQSALERDVRLFCYPQNRHNAAVKGFVRDAGFAAAFGGIGRVTRSADRFLLPRIQIERAMSIESFMNVCDSRQRVQDATTSTRGRLMRGIAGVTGLFS